eukprot:174609-Amorphochlora_amoeboformis.AAC.1
MGYGLRLGVCDDLGCVKVRCIGDDWVRLIYGLSVRIGLGCDGWVRLIRCMRIGLGCDDWVRLRLGEIR